MTYKKIAMVSVLWWLASVASAQDPVAAPQSKCNADEVVDQAAAMLANAVLESPTATPPLIENQSSPSSGSTTSNVEGASRTNLLALAFDANVVSTNSGVLTVSLAPVFDFIALRDPSVVDDQAKYRDYDWARRLGIKISGGGKGDAFDRDGDGVVDDALTATSLSDIVTYEVSWQFGSHDRRDNATFESLQRALKSLPAERDAAFDYASNLLLKAVLADRSLESASCKDLARRMLDNPAFRDAVESGYRTDRAMAPIVDEFAREIDNKPILRLVAQGTQRKAKFGGDKQSFGIRFSKGRADTASGGSNIDVQLDYLRNELPMGGDELEGWKLGTKYTSTWLRKEGWFGDKGLLFSAAGSVEKYSDVPPGQKDSIAKLDLTWSFSVGDKALVPLTITWANRTDLLQDKKDVIAHVGYSFDFDAFFQGIPH